MILNTLTLENVRRYARYTFHAQPGINVITGPNGVGKTTLLESLFILALTKSYKTNKDHHIKRHETPYFKIYGAFDSPPQTHRFDVHVHDKGKDVRVNQVLYPRLSDYLGRLHVVLFAPEDLDIIKGSPKTRRRFLDLELAQRDRRYISHLSHYKRLLKERNDWLKQGANQDHKEGVLDVITEQLAHYAQKIMIVRARFISELNDLMQAPHRALAPKDAPVHLAYEPSLPLDDPLGAYQKKRTLDWQFKTTQLGIHRDELRFTTASGPLADHGSQGQIRTAVLALKLALSQWFERHQQAPPILLLDDVLSELDQTRQKALLKELHQDAQVFITATHLEALALDHIALTHHPLHHEDNQRSDQP